MGDRQLLERVSIPSRARALLVFAGVSVSGASLVIFWALNWFLT